MSLVVDLGQSGSRIQLDGEIKRLPIAKKSSESVLETLKVIFETIPRRKIDTVYLSLTGLLGDVGDVQPFGELCKYFFDSSHVYVMDDGIAAYVGALGEHHGVALTLGGGVVAVSGNAGRFGHADGKGSIFGDFGGGFWIGQSAMKRAIATLDGRDNATDLVDLLSKELAQHTQLESKTGADAVNLCISAAKTVLFGAENGVENAQKILETAASYLSKTIIGAWNKVKTSNDQTPTITILGGLSQSQHYVDLIKRETALLLQFEFIKPAGDHLTGAIRAAQLYPEGFSPLFKVWHRTGKD